MNNQTEAVKCLLEKGANIDAKMRDGTTALLVAVCNKASFADRGRRKTEVARLLLEKGADIDAKDRQGKTVQACANQEGPDELVDILAQFVRQRKQLEQMQSKDPREQFAAYVRAFQESPKDGFLRNKVLQLANVFAEPPAVPEEARQLFILASEQIKQASTPAALDQPIALLRKCLSFAPWWADAYFNLSRALEMREQYDDAIQQLKYYLELKPTEADAREARAHIVVIQAEVDAAAHKQ